MISQRSHKLMQSQWHKKRELLIKKLPGRNFQFCTHGTVIYIFLTDQKFKIFFSALKNSIKNSALGAIKEHSMLVLTAKQGPILKGTGDMSPPISGQGGIKYLLYPPNLWQTQGHCP